MKALWGSSGEAGARGDDGVQRLRQLPRSLRFLLLLLSVSTLLADLEL